MNIANQLSQYQNALKICEVLQDARFVGGFVRDSILLRKPTDVDIATILLPNEVEEKLKANDITFHDVGKKYGTISAIFDNQVIEITTLRTDTLCDGRYAEVKYTKDWQEDALRRDFTINALSADKNGNIYDYVGGIADLKNKIVRFIGDPEQRIMEDYLRILRFFRFSSIFAEGLEEQGLFFCTKYADKIARLSRERVKSELYKLLNSSNRIATLKFMEPVLKKIFLNYENFIPDLLMIEQFEQKFKLKLAPEFFFALWDKNHNLPMTKKQLQDSMSIAKNREITLDYNALKQLFKGNNDLIKEIIAFNVIRQNVNISDSLLTSNLEKLFSLKNEKLPLTGKDLLALGIKAGESIGKLLKKAEQLWYQQEFKLTKQQIIEKIQDDKH
jgi:poly(A) polymerase